MTTELQTSHLILIDPSRWDMCSERHLGGVSRDSELSECFCCARQLHNFIKMKREPIKKCSFFMWMFGLYDGHHRVRNVRNGHSTSVQMALHSQCTENCFVEVALMTAVQFSVLQAGRSATDFRTLRPTPLSPQCPKYPHHQFSASRDASNNCKHAVTKFCDSDTKFDVKLDEPYMAQFANTCVRA